MEGCPYFDTETAQGISMVLKLRPEKYCFEDNTRCARYMVFKALGREHVPPTLLPSQVDKAEEIIRRATAKT
jgi:hypothetical protein